jgi:hypothetical protein
MKKLALLLCIVASAQAQEKTFWANYLNITELGIMPGRVEYHTDSWQEFPTVTAVMPRLSPTIQMFNGYKLSPKTALGLTMAIDGYGITTLMPLQLGIRQVLLKSEAKKAQIIGSLDAGYSLTALNIDNTNQKTSGGITINPMVGYRLPNKGGSAWLLNFGYKQQQATVLKNLQSDDQTSTESRSYRRFVFRLGFEF